MKRCSACQQILTLDLFSKDKSQADGLSRKCKVCVRSYLVAKGKLKPDGWERKTKDMTAYHRAYRAAHPDKFKEHNAKSRRTPEQEREYYILRMKRKFGEDWQPMKRGAAVSHEERLEKRRESYRKAALKLKETNPEKVKQISRVKHAKRRARLQEAGGSFTAKQLSELLKIQKNLCVVCKIKINKSYHADHIVPLAKGGSNEITNIQLLCSTCNISKGAKHPVDFMQSKGFLL